MLPVLPLHYNTLPRLTLLYSTLRYMDLYNTAQPGLTLQYTTLHCMEMHYTTLLECILH